MKTSRRPIGLGLVPAISHNQLRLQTLNSFLPPDPHTAHCYVTPDIPFTSQVFQIFLYSSARTINCTHPQIGYDDGPPAFNHGFDRNPSTCATQ